MLVLLLCADVTFPALLPMNKILPLPMNKILHNSLTVLFDIPTLLPTLVLDLSMTLWVADLMDDRGLTHSSSYVQYVVLRTT